MKIAASVLVILVLLVPGMVRGEPREGQKAREMIEAYRAWKLTEILDLSEEEMPVFFSRLKKIDEAEARFREAEKRAIEDMRLLLSREADDQQFQEAIQDFERIRAARWDELKRLKDDALSMLSVRQRCEYLVFEEALRVRIRNLIGDMRRRERPDK